MERCNMAKDLYQIIEIEDDCPVETYEKREGVEYGTVHHVTYFSNTTNCERGFNIILPPNYSEDKKYPLIFLLHGIFGNEHVLIDDENNKIVEILGNLKADGKAKEMILVLPHMYATGDPNMQPSFDPKSVLPYDNFINDLVNDLLPYVREHYSVLTDRDHQAIAGFSMGGRETLFIGLQRPDIFGYVCAIAPAPGLVPGKDWAMEHPGQLSEDEVKFKEGDELPHLLMVCCGSQDGTVGQFPKSYHEIFERNGVKHVWYEVPGADHNSQAIRSGLNNFLKTIF